MADGLYETDALAWAEQQSHLLRRIAGGERVNDAVDWLHVIDEVQDVGLSELRSCRSLLCQAMVHLLRLRAWPGSRATSHWLDEKAAFLDDACDRFSPSMRRRLELDELYADALVRVQAVSDDAGAPQPLPGQCPFALDELLVRRRHVPALVAKLAGDKATDA